MLCEMQAEDKMIPKAHILAGFDNSSVITKGEVTLTTFAESVVKDTKFQVIDMERSFSGLNKTFLLRAVKVKTHGEKVWDGKDE